MIYSLENNSIQLFLHLCAQLPRCAKAIGENIEANTSVLLKIKIGVFGVTIFRWRRAVRIIAAPSDYVIRFLIATFNIIAVIWTIIDFSLGGF